MEDSVMRKTFSSRKRGRDQISKTPSKVAVSVSVSSKCPKQYSPGPRHSKLPPTGLKATATGDVPGDGAAASTWIDNSFMSETALNSRLKKPLPRSQAKPASVPVKAVTRRLDSTKKQAWAGQPNDSNQGQKEEDERKSTRDRTVSVSEPIDFDTSHGDDVDEGPGHCADRHVEVPDVTMATSSQDVLNSDDGRSISSQPAAPRTPRSNEFSPWSQKGTMQVPSSPECYSSQHHQSFNQSDPLFADMIDHLDALTEHHLAQAQPAATHSPAGQHPHSHIHGASPNSKGDKVTTMNMIKRKSTTQESFTTSDFDRDDHLFAQLDLDIPSTDLSHNNCNSWACSNLSGSTQNCGDYTSQRHVSQGQTKASTGDVNLDVSSIGPPGGHNDPSSVPINVTKKTSIEPDIAEDIAESLDSIFFAEHSSPSRKPVVLPSNACVSPQNKPSNMSFKDRLKHTLQRNAQCSTPFSKRLEKRKEEKLVEVLKEAADIQQHGTEFDIGPFYGLPSKVRELLESQRGIKDLYAWQHECLSLPAVMQGHNLIYSLPTSGGKTLVAEILILRELLCKGRDALLVLPFVSIVQEKVRGLSQFAVELDFLVEEYAASKGQIPPRKRRNKKSLFIATIEKANSVVNSLIEDHRLDSVGLVVVDELHMLGDGGSRGATLEMTLAKIRHASKETQIIGMSATLNNIGDLQAFLAAELYTNDFRPVELTEYVKIEESIYKITPSALSLDDRVQHDRVLLSQYNANKQSQDPDQLAALALEVVPDYSCLVFCATKKNCENVAMLICKLMPRKVRERNNEERRSLLKALIHDGNGEVCPVLRLTLPYGVAYHHSGLTMDERKLIEEAYSEGTLCLLACTSTLAAGVNLPAKRVILRSPYVGRSFLSRSQYKQMIGRAGRAGIDATGESILILQKKDKAKMLELISGPFDNCRSSLLYEEGKGLRGLLLTTIGLQITPSVQSILEFMQCTLCHVQSAQLNLDVLTLVNTALQHLLDLNLVAQRSKVTVDNQSLPVLEVTNLGRAVFKGSIDLDRGPHLYRDLCQAQQSLVLANYLHLLYLVTPYDMVEQVMPNWMTYLDEMSRLDPAELKVASQIGVSQSHITHKATGQRTRKNVDEFAVKRFYLSLMLYQLWQQKSIWEVSACYQQPRGFVQQLLTGAASFAACVTHFCQELEEFWAYQELLSGFVKRLSYCVSTELIPLLEIPGVKIGRSRQLYTAGFCSLQQVAYADPEALVKKIEHMPRKIARQLVAAAQMLLTEKAENLRQDAEDLVAMPTTEITSETMDSVLTAGSENIIAMPV